MANSVDRVLDEFTTGFQYSFYGDFHPYTYGAGLAGDITGTMDGDASNNTLTMTSLFWGATLIDGDYRRDFDAPADPGTLTATVIADHNDGSYDISLAWNHVIQSPGESFHLQNLFWYTEFTVTTVPLPATGWLLGYGLLGLLSLARRRKKMS